jgi:lipoprotein-releasing system permease protein
VSAGGRLIKSLPLSIGLRYFSSAGRSGLLVSFISALALSGLALGVGLLILVLSIMNGFDREMREHILSIVPHVQLFNPATIDHWQEEQKRIAALDEVIEVTPFNQAQGLLFTARQTKPVEVLGLSEQAIPSGLGKLLESQGLALPESSQLLLSVPLAQALNLRPGNSVRLVFPSDQNRQAQVHLFTLSGVFATHTEVDQVLAIASMARIGEIAGTGAGVQGFRVQVNNELNARAIAYSLIGSMPPGYVFRDWFQTHGNLHQAIRLSRNLVALLIFLIVGIAAFNVISMLMMSVIDKRKDIAVLQTLGLSENQVLQIFLLQGALIGLLGIGLGIVLGVLGCYWIGDIILSLEALLGSKFLNTSVYPIDYIPLDLRWSDVLLVSISAFCLTLLATIYPARSASKTVPAEELRYDV